jgi:hypothetical protein
MKSLGVYHQSYYNQKAFQFAYNSFRTHFPTSPYVIYSDNGDDFSEYVSEHCYYRHSNVRNYGTGENAYWRDNVDMFINYYTRIKDACELCKTDYMLMMEDDVYVTKSFQITEDFDMVGPCRAKLDSYLVQFITQTIGREFNDYYGMCGGSMFRTSIFVDNFNTIIDNLHKYQEKMAKESHIASVGDGNLTVQFNLLGYNYKCSQWMQNGTIIHPYKNYY